MHALRNGLTRDTWGTDMENTVEEALRAVAVIDLVKDAYGHLETHTRLIWRNLLEPSRAVRDIRSDPEVNEALSLLPPHVVEADLVNDILSEHGFIVTSDSQDKLYEGTILATKVPVIPSSAGLPFGAFLSSDDRWGTLKFPWSNMLKLKDETIQQIDSVYNAQGKKQFSDLYKEYTLSHGKEIAEALSDKQYLTTIAGGIFGVDSVWKYFAGPDASFYVKWISNPGLGVQFALKGNAKNPPWVGIGYPKQEVINDLRKILRKTGEVDNFKKPAVDTYNLSADQLFLLRELELSGRESIPSVELRKLPEARVPFIKELLDKNKVITKDVIIKAKPPAEPAALAKVAMVCRTHYKVWEGAQRIWSGKDNNVFLVTIPQDNVVEALGSFPTAAQEYMTDGAYGHPNIGPTELTFGWVRCTEFGDDIWIDEVQTDINDMYPKETFKELGGMKGVAKFLMERFLSQMRGRGYQKFFMPSYGWRAEFYHSDPPISIYEDVPGKLRFQRRDLQLTRDGAKVEKVDVAPKQVATPYLKDVWQDAKLFRGVHTVDIKGNVYSTGIAAVPTGNDRYVAYRWVDDDDGGFSVTIRRGVPLEDINFGSVHEYFSELTQTTKSQLTVREVANLDSLFSKFLVDHSRSNIGDGNDIVPNAWVLASTKPTRAEKTLRRAANVIAGHEETLGHPYAYHGSGETGLTELEGNWPPYAGGLGYGVYMDYRLETAQFYGEHVYRVKLAFPEDKIFDLAADSDNRWYIKGLEGRSILVGEQLEPFTFELNDTVYAVVDGEGGNDDFEDIISRMLLREALPRLSNSTDNIGKLARAILEDAFRTDKKLNSYDLADVYVDEWFAHREAAGHPPTDQDARALHKQLDEKIKMMLAALEELADLPEFISLDEIGSIVQKAGYRAVYFERGGDPGTELLVFDPNDVQIVEELS